MVPPTPMSTLVFGAFMGFLWLGVGPLVAGAVAELFGLQWQAMIQGLAFMSHQLGSFLGAYGGGLIYDSLGSYDMAWRAGVALGLSAGHHPGRVCADPADSRAAGVAHGLGWPRPSKSPLRSAGRIRKTSRASSTSGAVPSQRRTIS